MGIIDEYANDQAKLEAISKVAIRGSAWWDTHVSGKPVRARGDARRVIWSDSFKEYILPFGKTGNKLVVSRAVKGVMASAEKSEEKDLDKLVESLRVWLTSSVANHRNDYYSDYPTSAYSGNYIQFGSHSISISDFIYTVLECSKILRRYGKQFTIA